MKKNVNKLHYLAVFVLGTIFGIFQKIFFDGMPFNSDNLFIGMGIGTGFLLVFFLFNKLKSPTAGWVSCGVFVILILFSYVDGA